MKNITYFFISVFIFFLPSSNLVGQDACGTNEKDQSTSYVFKKEAIIPKRDRSRVAYVPIKFHIISAVNGAFAIDSSQVFDELEEVNAQFGRGGIEFVHCGNINYIKDNNFFNFTQYESETICDINDVFDVINVYFVQTLNDDDGEGTLCGYAYNFDVKQRLIMANSCSTNGSTLTHELGHTFSLPHTHSTSRGRELVDGSNCTTAGDRICDTPADPRLGTDVVNSSCEYRGTEVDPNGDLYIPDVSNIMSYSRKSCRNNFSEGQLDIIVDFYDKIASVFYCESLPTSTFNAAYNAAIKIFPNPIIDEVSIVGELPFTEIHILDLTGRPYFDKQFSEPVNSLKISTDRFPIGTYIVSIINGDRISNKTITKLF